MTPEASVVGLLIQTTGIALVALLSSSLTRTISHRALWYWTLAWTALTLSLASLSLAFSFPGIAGPFQIIYLVGKYAFCYLFIVGCRNYATGAVLSRRDVWVVPAAFGMAVLLLWASGGQFNTLFIPHAAIVGYLLSVAFRALGPARRREGRHGGLKVMSLALALLSLDFFHYVPVFTIAVLSDYAAPNGYLRYTSLYDLIFEVLLGFGTVMLVTEGVRRELETANRELTAARDRLEVLVRRDPLTESLNRHAFYSLIDSHDHLAAKPAHGSVGLIDIDDLKIINDTMGHAAGDVVIRAVAKAIRLSIRPDDLLFRWGGDEFLVLLFGVSDVEARARFANLGESLASVAAPGLAVPILVTVSCGVAPFPNTGTLEQAIERADNEMYGQKQRRRMAMGA
jgi:diguanylate cyclase (GGDEF)-like protein